ncbi:MAG: Rho termination factor N-terminal domain-containing protein, partial [Actinobacteria bacterium]|nr:Rho termination factor N-terminal domain-containing protein [Actinomycetota bacterium]
MSDTDLLGGDVPAAASSEERPVDQAGTAESASDDGVTPRRRGGLSGMVMAELRELAGRLGISDTAGMRKGDLISAIKERQGAGPERRSTAGEQLPLEASVAPTSDAQPAPGTSPEPTTGPDGGAQRAPEPDGAERENAAEPQDRDSQDADQQDQDGGDRPRNRRRRSARGGETTRSEGEQNQGDQRNG